MRRKPPPGQHQDFNRKYQNLDHGTNYDKDMTFDSHPSIHHRSVLADHHNLPPPSVERQRNESVERVLSPQYPESNFRRCEENVNRLGGMGPLTFQSHRNDTSGGACGLDTMFGVSGMKPYTLAGWGNLHGDYYLDHDYLPGAEAVSRTIPPNTDSLGNPVRPTARSAGSRSGGHVGTIGHSAQSEKNSHSHLNRPYSAGFDPHADSASAACIIRDLDRKCDRMGGRIDDAMQCDDSSSVVSRRRYPESSATDEYPGRLGHSGPRNGQSNHTSTTGDSGSTTSAPAAFSFRDTFAHLWGVSSLLDHSTAALRNVPPQNTNTGVSGMDTTTDTDGPRARPLPRPPISTNSATIGGVGQISDTTEDMCRLQCHSTGALTRNNPTRSNMGAKDERHPQQHASSSAMPILGYCNDMRSDINNNAGFSSAIDNVGAASKQRQTPPPNYHNNFGYKTDTARGGIDTAESRQGGYLVDSWFNVNDRRYMHTAQHNEPNAPQSLHTKQIQCYSQEGRNNGGSGLSYVGRQNQQHMRPPPADLGLYRRGELSQSELLTSGLKSLILGGQRNKARSSKRRFSSDVLFQQPPPLQQQVVAADREAQGREDCFNHYHVTSESDESFHDPRVVGRLPRTEASARTSGGYNFSAGEQQNIMTGGLSDCTRDIGCGDMNFEGGVGSASSGHQSNRVLTPVYQSSGRTHSADSGTSPVSIPPNDTCYTSNYDKGASGVHNGFNNSISSKLNYMIRPDRSNDFHWTSTATATTDNSKPARGPTSQSPTKSSPHYPTIDSSNDLGCGLASDVTTTVVDTTVSARAVTGISSMQQSSGISIDSNNTKHLSDAASGGIPSTAATDQSQRGMSTGYVPVQTDTTYMDIGRDSFSGLCGYMTEDSQRRHLQRIGGGIEISNRSIDADDGNRVHNDRAFHERNHLDKLLSSLFSTMGNMYSNSLSSNPQGAMDMSSDCHRGDVPSGDGRNYIRDPNLNTSAPRQHNIMPNNLGPNGFHSESAVGDNSGLPPGDLCEVKGLGDEMAGGSLRSSGIDLSYFHPMDHRATAFGMSMSPSDFMGESDNPAVEECQTDRFSNVNSQIISQQKTLQQTFKNAESVAESRHGKPNARPALYATYMRQVDAIEGVNCGRLKRGVLRVSHSKTDQAYISQSDAKSSNNFDLIIKNRSHRNRAVHGDVVIVEVLPSKEWVPVTNPFLPTPEPQEAEEDTSAKMQAKSVGVEDSAQIQYHEACTVVRIEEMCGSDRPYVCTLRPNLTRGSATATDKDPDSLAIPSGAKMIKAVPVDVRIPWMLIPISEAAKWVDISNCLPKLSLFLVRIVKWDETSVLPLGGILKHLGEAGDIECEERVCMIDNLLGNHLEQFDEALEEEAQSLVSYRDYDEVNELKQRKDLRSSRIFTIDPATARDLDDAIHITVDDSVSPPEYEIGVHIADVTHYVRPDTRMDEEAKKRTTTVYLPHKCFPMLPRALCERLCSLNPNETKLTMTVVFRMNDDGTLNDKFKPRFDATAISSCARFSYDDVDEIFDQIGEEARQLPTRTSPCYMGDTAHTDMTSPVISLHEHAERVLAAHELPMQNVEVYGVHKWRDIVKDLLLLERITQNMRKLRYEHGSLNIQKTKLRFNMDQATHTPTGFALEKHTTSHELIEELMLMANKLIAKKILDGPGVAVLRHHEGPLSNRVKDLYTLLEKIGVTANFATARTAFETFASFKKDYGAAFTESMQHLLLKATSTADYITDGYAPNNLLFHWALSFDIYTHFTSPIRRYADILVHRCLRATLAAEQLPDQDNKSGSEDEQVLQEICEKCNESRLHAKKASESCDTAFLVLYLKIKKDICVLPSLVTKVKDRYIVVYMPTLGREKQIFFKNFTLGCDAPFKDVCKPLDKMITLPEAVVVDIPEPTEGRKVILKLILRWKAPRGWKRSAKSKSHIRSEAVANADDDNLNTDDEKRITQVVKAYVGVLPVYVVPLDKAPVEWTVFPVPPFDDKFRDCQKSYG